MPAGIQFSKDFKIHDTITHSKYRIPQKKLCTVNVYLGTIFSTKEDNFKIEPQIAETGLERWLS